MLEAARVNGVKRYPLHLLRLRLPEYLQERPTSRPLKESDAYPADAEDGYGWEKLFTERLCRYYREDHGLETRVVRFHNIFGPLGTYDGGREKSPAAICRKVALARTTATRSRCGATASRRAPYCYIDDCVEGIYRLMHSDFREPLNLGQDRLITINELVDIVSDVAGKTLVKRHDLPSRRACAAATATTRSLREVLGWEPPHLEDGLERHLPLDRGLHAEGGGRPGRGRLSGGGPSPWPPIRTGKVGRSGPVSPIRVIGGWTSG